MVCLTLLACLALLAWLTLHPQWSMRDALSLGNGATALMEHAQRSMRHEAARAGIPIDARSAPRTL